MKYCVEYDSEDFINNRSNREVLDTCLVSINGFGTQRAEYYHCTAGYELAGSAARLTKEKWGYTWYENGCAYGRSFGNEDNAAAAYADFKSKWKV